jgi:hypothetical protein
MKNLTVSLFSQQNNQASVLLEISSSYLVSIICNACIALQRVIVPGSPYYVIPIDDVGSCSHFVGQAALWSEINNFDRRMTGQMYYVWLWQPLTLIEAYAQHRNKSPMMVGEEFNTIVLIYNTLVFAHNWRCLSVKDSFRKNGTDMGSATGWHTYDFLKDVLDWPERFNFTPLPISLFPREALLQNPDFYKE